MNAQHAAILRQISRPLFFVLILVCLALPGCVPKTSQILQEGFNQGKSIVITRNSPWYAGMIWSLVPDRPEAGISFNQYAIGGDYAAARLLPGIYYAHTAQVISSPYRLQEGRSAPSRLGTVRIVKPPERVCKEVYDFELMKYVEECEDRKTNFYIRYAFSECGWTDSDAATISLAPGDIVLLPHIWATIEFDKNRTTLVEPDPFFLSKKIEPSLPKVAKVVEVLEAILSIGGSPKETYVWEAPLSRLIIHVSPANLEAFRASVDLEKLPPELLSRVRLGEFTPGPFLKKAHQTKSFPDGSMQYIYTKNE